LTLAVLERMAAGRRRDAWEHTSRLLAKLHNVHCTRAADLLTPADFDVTLGRRGRRPGAVQTNGAYHRAMYEALSKEAG
jgi:hypothetical protein